MLIKEIIGSRDLISTELLIGTSNKWSELNLELGKSLESKISEFTFEDAGAICENDQSKDNIWFLFLRLLNRICGFLINIGKKQLIEFFELLIWNLELIEDFK